MAVDREEFAKKVTENLKNNPNIEVINKEVVSEYDKTIVDENKKTDVNVSQEKSKINKLDKNSTQENDKSDVNPIFFEDLINEDAITIIATGPLTSDSLSIGIKKLTGENDLHFYDAGSPNYRKR